MVEFSTGILILFSAAILIVGNLALEWLLGARRNDGRNGEGEETDPLQRCGGTPRKR